MFSPAPVETPVGDFEAEYRGALQGAHETVLKTMNRVLQSKKVGKLSIKNINLNNTFFFLDFA